MWRSLLRMWPTVQMVSDFETAGPSRTTLMSCYTYSQSADEVSLALAEEVTGTVTRAEQHEGRDVKALTIGGTKYNASKMIAGEDINVSVDEEYTVYLDAYGYMIYVEQNDEIGDYACWSTPRIKQLLQQPRSAGVRRRH